MDPHRSEEALVECVERQMARPHGHLFQNYYSTIIILPYKNRSIGNTEIEQRILVSKASLWPICSYPTVAPEHCPL